ncbi:MAG: hypothetical protein IBX45_01080 [Campylobacterales bacterium]|nr:hypothetical protein [Campylobacterales bacterium]
MYPQFFDEIPPIVLKDDLACLLGTFDEGRVEITYLECIKMAGHSCPTVAGAYILTKIALETLFPLEIPQRGLVRIAFKEPKTSGVTGVMAQVMTNITGAADEGGFKGLGGAFVRAQLLSFDQPIEGMVQFTRVDTGASVSLSYFPNLLPQNPDLALLMKNARLGDKAAQDAFGVAWQERVREVVFHYDKHGLVRVDKSGNF